VIGDLAKGAIALAVGLWVVYAVDGLLILVAGLGSLCRDALKDLGAAGQKIERAEGANAGLLTATRVPSRTIAQRIPIDCTDGPRRDEGTASIDRCF
jgi:hypothetical protein